LQENQPIKPTVETIDSDSDDEKSLQAGPQVLSTCDATFQGLIELNSGASILQVRFMT
jgi:hypothetical protein